MNIVRRVPKKSYEIFVRVSEGHGEKLEELQRVLANEVSAPSKKDLVEFMIKETYKKYVRGEGLEIE